MRYYGMSFIHHVAEVIFGLISIVGIVFILLIIADIKIKNINRPNQNMNNIEYKFCHTLEFIDKDTGYSVVKLTDIELTALDKDGYIYAEKLQRKTVNDPPYILVIDKCPPNTYIRFGSSKNE